MLKQETKVFLTFRLATIFVFVMIFSPVAAEDVSFQLDVMQVMSKSGCNLGTCHGNARGKGGFQISLRGQDPVADYQLLTHDLFGRRVNTANPDQSLILLKPTMQLAHEGGKRFEIHSPEYNVIQKWIASGLKNDPKDSPKLVQLDVSPAEAYLSGQSSNGSNEAKAGWDVQINATAKFSDGSTRDVTSLAVYEIAHPIAEVSHDGRVVGRSTGETTVLVRYLDQQAPVRIAFLESRSQFEWSGPEPTNFVDEHVFAKLRKLQINPSPICDDATFIRRVSLDLIGLSPTADEARRFVSDSNTNKRGALIDSLMERTEFSEWWAGKWADLLRVEEKTMDRKGVESFHAWLRNAFANNRPMDEFVREIVISRGSTYEVPQANFYLALQTPFDRSESIGQLFLGVRLQCAKCHNHPFDRWTQDDYYSWGSVFARVDYKPIEHRRLDDVGRRRMDGEQIVYINSSGVADDPRTGKPRSPRFLGNQNDLDQQRDPLNDLAGWLTDPKNERFSLMMANRIWQQIMSRGIVDPVDDFRATNPPSNPQLLKALASELANGPGGSRMSSASSATIKEQLPGVRNAGAFDLRHLLRTILNSKTYQFASDPNETNRRDETNFSRAIVHRLSAEQILDAISQALNVAPEFAHIPKGRRAAQLAGIPNIRPNDKEVTDADRFLRTFGKPPRQQSCDCERSDETTLGQTFQLVSGPLMNRMLSAENNRLDSLLKSKRPYPEILTELFWTSLNRAPTSIELNDTVHYLESASNPRTAIEDIAWALFNSNEFLLRR